MRRRVQQSGGQLVGLLATAVYLLTMDRSVSWWDCGEFIATSWTLGIGHPPGAPTYQLLAHLVMLLGAGHPTWLAPLSNALSALCGGVTVGLLFASLRLMGCRGWAALTGALCFLFCDTAWFSAVESEVYSMAMLICSALFYLALRFRHTGNARLLPLMGLLLGLGVGVHLMTLLVLPALVLLLWPCRHATRTLAATLLFFLLGTSTYAIVPLRAAATPAINEYDGDMEAYLLRKRYKSQPLYPRMWREKDADNWATWNLHRTDFLGNVAYAATYQVGYMYLRYLMYNFIGRENMKHHRTVLFVLPLLLGLIGVWHHFRSRRAEAWATMLLFLFGGLLLNLYLNHPCYEPRERDYVYVLSFYAFALWIGVGANWLSTRLPAAWHCALLIGPLLMALGNWSDHDRSHCHSVHDVAMAHLQSCQPDALLITLGDNDTFPLWYLQLVEHERTDVRVMNVGLEGGAAVMQAITENLGQRPVYFTHYFYQSYGALFERRLRCEGYCWQLLPEGDDDTAPRRPEGVRWHITPHEYLDPISHSMLAIWQRNTGEDPRTLR